MQMELYTHNAEYTHLEHIQYVNDSSNISSAITAHVTNSFTKHFQESFAQTSQAS